MVRGLFKQIILGKLSDEQVAVYLKEIAQRGETAEEIEELVKALLKEAKLVDIPKELRDEIIDVCGTGGDGKHTYNISTTIAFVLAGGGVKIAKHGNRSVSSKAGSSDVLQALGVNLDLSREKLLSTLQDINICFLMAPLFHPVMKNVAHIRKELGIRTIFNLVGPLLNPMRPKRQVIGVSDKKYIAPIANVLKNLGTKHAVILCGEDGMDEATIFGKTYAAELKNGEIKEFAINPENYGIKILQNQDLLKGGDADYNANALKNILSNKNLVEKDQPYLNAVLLNAAIGFYVADKVRNIKDGIMLAKDSIESGRALQALEELTNIE